MYFFEVGFIEKNMNIKTPDIWGSALNLDADNAELSQHEPLGIPIGFSHGIRLSEVPLSSEASAAGPVGDLHPKKHIDQ